MLAIFSLALIASLAEALPGTAVAAADDPRFTQWSPPGAGDVRSPCPGLNSLANHGFLPHSGKNISLSQLVTGLEDGLNVGPDFGVAVGSLALLASPNRLGGTFNLNDIDEHNFPIEHDGSLSRQDFYNGNDYSFYAPAWDTVLSYYEGQTVTTLKPASDARYARISHSNQTNPTFTYGLQQFIFSYGETALYMQTMSDPTTGQAPIEYVRSLFEREKLPYELGWRPSTQPITLQTLGNFIVELNAVSPDPLAEDFYVTANSYKDVIDDILGLAGIRNPTVGG